MFYDKVNILKHYFQNQSSIVQLNIAMRNAANPYTFEFQDFKNREISLSIGNVGAAICILNKSLSCWKFIMEQRVWLFNVAEVFDLLKLISA
mmetsp:Transcript_40025/g.29525  ORF Transcript_40025/g.29525 Transcript_40025/m.29525 type:complete len:92 (+) Transcript_40025:125-400(+)